MTAATGVSGNSTREKKRLVRWDGHPCPSMDRLEACPTGRKSSIGTPYQLIRSSSVALCSHSRVTWSKSR